MSKEHEAIKQSNFARILDERELPILLSEVLAFEKVTQQHNPPPGFYERLVTNLDYLHPKTFRTEMERMTALAKDLLADDYTLLVRRPEGSGLWIYQQLVASGLHPAQRGIATRYGKIDDIVPVGSTVFAPDDWAIQGAQIVDLLLAANPKKYNVHTIVMRSTAKGDELVHRYGEPTSYHSLGRVLDISEALPLEDRQFLRTLDEIYNPNKNHGELFYPETTGSSLAFSWHKIPDNFPSMLTGYPCLPPLVRPERFIPPYRKTA